MLKGCVKGSEGVGGSFRCHGYPTPSRSSRIESETSIPKPYALPIGSKVVPFWGSYIESKKVIPKRNNYGAYG